MPSALSSTFPDVRPDRAPSSFIQHALSSCGLVWSIANIRCREDLQQLLPLLDGIDWADSGAVLFQTGGWLAAAADGALRRPATEVSVLIARQDDVPVAIIPLAISRRFGIRVARTLGDPLAQYSDCLMRDDAGRWLSPDAIRTALALLPQVDVFLFRHVRDDAKMLPLIREMGGVSVARSAAPYADLAQYPDFDQFLKANWKAHRNRDRLRRRAQKDGELTFEVAASAARAAELARHAIKLKQDWLRARFRHFGTLSSPNWCAALVDAVERPTSSTRSIVTALHRRGKPAAIEVAFVRRAHYYAFLGAFDPECASWSPTDLLMEDTLRWCFNNAIEIYDLLPPDDSYKGKWTNAAMPVSDWAVYRSPSGRLYGELRGRYLPPLMSRIFRATTRAHKIFRP